MYKFSQLDVGVNVIVQSACFVICLRGFSSATSPFLLRNKLLDQIIIFLAHAHNSQAWKKARPHTIKRQLPCQHPRPEGRGLHPHHSHHSVWLAPRRHPPGRHCLPRPVHRQNQQKGVYLLRWKGHGYLPLADGPTFLRAYTFCADQSCRETPIAIPQKGNGCNHRRTKVFDESREQLVSKLEL